jgi:uncharacterized Zn-finger protein
MCSLFVPCCSNDLAKFHLLYDRKEVCDSLNTLCAIASNAQKIYTPKGKYRSHSWDSQISDLSMNEGRIQVVPSRCAKWKYTCSVCQKLFERPSTLKTHMNSHTGERPFGCPNKSCKRSFTVRSNMMRHHKKCIKV